MKSLGQIAYEAFAKARLDREGTGMCSWESLDAASAYAWLRASDAICVADNASAPADAESDSHALAVQALLDIGYNPSVEPQARANALAFVLKAEAEPLSALPLFSNHYKVTVTANGR